jgi:hypothetical protein
MKEPEIQKVEIKPICKSGIYELVEAGNAYGEDLSFFRCVEEEDYVEEATDNNDANINNSISK